jgi:hypothetical protein
MLKMFIDRHRRLRMAVIVETMAVVFERFVLKDFRMVTGQVVHSHESSSRVGAL